MTLATAAKEELKRIQSRLKSDDPAEADPIKRAFATYGLAPGARLRQIYQAKLDAERQYRELAVLGDQADQLLRQLGLEHRAIVDRVIAARELPIADDGNRRAWLVSQAELLQETVPMWRAAESSYQLRAGDLSREWDAAWSAYTGIMWQLVGDELFRPAWVVRDPRDPQNERGWVEPDSYVRQYLEQQRASLET